MECTIVTFVLWGLGTLIDINELLGLEKKSETSFSCPINGIESGNSRSKNVMRSCGVFNEEIIDSGINNVHVNDLS